jgi:hypothetical protein
MFGYLLSLIGPDADSRDTFIAQNLLPFAAPNCPGLGMRLVANAEELLRQKGIYKIFGRTGIRGDGLRMGVLYERRGYMQDGTLYSKELQPWVS